MTDTPQWDINDIVDGQKIGLSTWLFCLVALLALVSDGFDLAAMGYIAPELVKGWHISPARLVPAFSAGIIGMMVGGPLLGVLGDKFGRKRIIVGGLFAIGIATLATTLVRGIGDLVVLRFLTGVGLGGVIPNVVALVAEVTPRQIRGRLLAAVSLGIVVGIASPGFVAAWLVPHHGWHALLVVGGLLPILVAVLSLIFAPESIKYLLERGDRDDQVRALARRIRPDLAIGPDTRIVLPAQRASMLAMPANKRLFAGGLAVVTPLLWFCQAANQMANFFSLTWLPTLLQSAGATTAQAGMSAAMFSIGGLLGGLVLIFIIDRWGMVPMVVLFACGTPLVAAMAMTDISPGVHAAIIAGAGLCVTGIQIGITAFLGILYPTPIRSLGTGWTQAAGRVGALAAPIVGGILLDMKIPTSQLTLAPAILLALGAVASVFLLRQCYKAFGGVHITEFPEPEQLEI